MKPFTTEIQRRSAECRVPSAESPHTSALGTRHSALPLCASVVKLFVILATIGCNSPTAPVDAAPKVTGRLSGLVKIGPNCPVEQENNPCPTQPSAYAARKILVMDEPGTKILFTVDIDAQGLYVIDLPPARYRIDLKRAGIDRTTELPTVVEIHANSVTTLNVNIDTGLR